MDVKPGPKHSNAVGVTLKPPSNESLASRIDHALEDEKNRREQLSRRPSYRKILKELGGSKAVSTNERAAVDENEDADAEDALSAPEPTNGATTEGDRRLAAQSSKPMAASPATAVSHGLSTGSNGQSPALRNARSPNTNNSNGSGNGNGTPQSNAFESHESVTLNALNANAHAQLSGALSSPHFVGLIPAGLNMNVVQVEGASQHLGTLLASAAQPAAILQYAQQGLDGQLYIPAAANVQAYQMAAAASANSSFGVGATQPLFVATAPSASTSGGSSASPLGPAQPGGDDSTRKREMRLLKNREAARECRRKKKEYVKCLENRVAVLESQNKTLIEELKALKELYCSKDSTGGPTQPASGVGPHS